MSAWVTGLVWKRSQHKGSELLVLLAIADNAKDNGRDAWPSVATLAEKTRLSERNVRYVIRKLQESGELIVEEKASKFGTNLYHIQLGDERSGAKIAPGVRQNPIGAGAKSDTIPLQNHADPPAIAIAPKPSVNRQIKPSEEPERDAPARAKAFPRVFEISDAMLDWADRLDFSAAVIEHETEKFCHDRLAKGLERVDWEEDWRLWMMRSRDGPLRRGG